MTTKPMRFTCALLATLLMAASCGGDTTVSNDTTTAAPDETTAAEPVGYPYYEGNDFGGETFTVLNANKNLHSMICYLTVEEQNGEAVNDTIYNRNQKVMEKLNCVIEEVNVGQNDLLTTLQTSILAGDNEYQATYEFMHQMPSGITEGWYYCLNDIDTIHLEESWWDPVMRNATSIAGKSYFATSSAHLMSIDGIWCLFFNESMMDDLGMEYPYQLVRDGDWTLDALRKYTKVAANLNGADDFAKKADSPAVYGCTSFTNSTAKFIYGAGGQYFTKDKDDMPVFNADSEIFVNSLQKLASFMSTPGEYLMADNETVADTSYVTYFKQQKALFLAAEIKAAQTLRDMEQSFGIVPFPKADENQESYNSTCLHSVCVFSIPTTNPEPEKVGLLFDALSWESDEMVLDPYFSVLVEQKGLRNEESIEMLNIIKSTRSVDIGIAYQWAAGLESSLTGEMFHTTPNIASSVASYKDGIQVSLNAMLDAMGIE